MEGQSRGRSFIPPSTSVSIKAFVVSASVEIMNILSNIIGRPLEYVSITWKVVDEEPEAYVHRSGRYDRDFAPRKRKHANGEEARVA